MISLLNKRERRVTEKEREEKELDTVIKDSQKGVEDKD